LFKRVYHGFDVYMSKAGISKDAVIFTYDLLANILI